MKPNLLHLLLLTTCSPLVVVAVQPTAECIRLAQSANCSFYTECVERSIPCGPSGYVVGYGYHFCNTFVADHHRVCVCARMCACVRACVCVCMCMHLCVCHSFVIITLVLPQQTVILSRQTVGILFVIAIH